MSKSYIDLINNDNRPLDEWGKAIGKKYEDKEWENLNKEEMMADFDWKNDILESYGEAVTCSSFYQDYLFNDLFWGDISSEEYKVIITEYDADKGSKVHKVNVDEIDEYLSLNDVALSPCLFYNNWRRKNLLNYVCAFVLDIDRLRPQQLDKFFKRFELNMILRPTFIANSGSGVHFYYVLDHFVKVDSAKNEANRQICDQIYKSLYDDIKVKNAYKDAQRHWIGQDYRIVNSKTKLNQTSQIYKIGKIYTFDELRAFYDIKIEPKSQLATPKMVKYAKGIAKNLNIDLPNFESSKETYDFIKEHKDEAFKVRENKRKELENKVKKAQKKNKSKTWYANTLYHMRDNTKAGYRYSSLKALAVIAHIENVKREQFIEDLNELIAYWSTLNWNNDNFNMRNIPGILRFYDSEQYHPKPETLEDWLGYEFKRIGVKRNGLKQKDHLEIARAIQTIKDKQQGKNWRDGNGRKSKEEIVKEWLANNPNGKKIECERETGLSRHTVLKWWEK